MRLALLLVIAACDFRPAPKPVVHRDAAEVDAAPAPAVTVADASELDAGEPPSADCTATAEHIAAVVIDSADAGARGSFEKARADMVPLMAAACTKQRWTADRQQCMRLAKLAVDVRACESKYPIAR
jgi:hypothetical protein